MKKLILSILFASSLVSFGAVHTYFPMLQGPTTITVTNVADTTTTIQTTTVSATNNLPLIFYTNSAGKILQANNRYFYYITNSVVGDTNVTGWRANLNTSAPVNPSAFYPAQNFVDVQGDQQTVPFVLSYTKSGSSASSTNAIFVNLQRSYDGVNYVFDGVYQTLHIPSSAEQTSVQTISTNLSTSWLAGVKSVKLYTIQFSTNAPATTHTLNIYNMGIAGFAP